MLTIMNKVLIYLTATLGLLSAVACKPNPVQGEFLGSIDTVVNGVTIKKLLTLLTTPLTFPEAYVYCQQAHNGKLVQILSEPEDKFVHNELILKTVDAAWTSGHYENNAWRWGDGTLMTYEKWGLGYPGSTAEAAYVFASGLQNYDWRTAARSTKLPFICEEESVE